MSSSSSSAAGSASETPSTQAEIVKIGAKIDKLDAEIEVIKNGVGLYGEFSPTDKRDAIAACRAEIHDCNEQLKLLRQEKALLLQREQQETALQQEAQVLIEKEKTEQLRLDLEIKRLSPMGSGKQTPKIPRHSGGSSPSLSAGGGGAAAAKTILRSISTGHLSSGSPESCTPSPPSNASRYREKLASTLRRLKPEYRLSQTGGCLCILLGNNTVFQIQTPAGGGENVVDNFYRDLYYTFFYEAALEVDVLRTLMSQPDKTLNDYSGQQSPDLESAFASRR